MKSTRVKLKQATPAELVNSVMATTRHLFCPQMDDKTWMKTCYHFVRERCVLWAANFIVSKNFTLPANRLQAILVEIVKEAKFNATGRIAYVPGYLAKCVQSHFRIHWEEYYQESKSLVAQADAALLRLGKLPDAPDRTVENLAAVAAVLKGAKKKAKVDATPRQISLF